MGTAPAPAGRAHRHRFESPFWRKLVIAGVRAMPFGLQRATMPMWAGIFYALVPSARRAVENNLAQVLGEGGHALGPAGPQHDQRPVLRQGDVGA